MPKKKAGGHVAKGNRGRLDRALSGSQYEKQRSPDMLFVTEIRGMRDQVRLCQINRTILVVVPGPNQPPLLVDGRTGKTIPLYPESRSQQVVLPSSMTVPTLPPEPPKEPVFPELEEDDIL